MKKNVVRRTIDDFVELHGEELVDDLKKQLEIERKKVESLRGERDNFVVKKSSDNIIRFAVTSDRHIGSIKYYDEAVHAFYEIVKQEGITDVYDVGDVLDGHRVYRGQEFEMLDVGYEAQLKRMVDSSPRIKGVTTHFITGNHDTSFKKLVGMNPAYGILQKRDDWDYLGEHAANIRFETPNGQFRLSMLHPIGGTAYAVSWRPQKIIEAIQGGNKPHIILIGHYHKAENLPVYRNVCSIQAGTFQKQTDFMMTKGIQAHIGGWIIEVYVGGNYNRFKTEFVAFYP